MKKYLLILFLVILCTTGCEATYNLNITETGMTESVDFLVPDNKENQNILKQYLSSTYMAYYNMDRRESVNYEKKEISQKNKIGMNLSNTYRGDDLQKSSLLDKCYYQKSVIKSDDEIIITTDGKTSCFYKDQVKTLDKLVINITTDLKVTESNADKVEGHTYKWIIDETNYQNHPINIRMKIVDKQTMSSNIVLWIIIGGLIIAAFAIFTYIQRKNRKNNELT